jgi:hypothetical protein
VSQTKKYRDKLSWCPDEDILVHRQLSFSVAEPELGVVMEKFGSLLQVTAPLLMIRAS